MVKKRITKAVANVSRPLPAGSELSRWEIQFRDETGKLPASLGLNTRIAARDWLDQHPDAKQILAEDHQQDLIALDALLEEHGHKRRADLPTELHERLAKGLSALVWDEWDSLTEEGRREQGVWWVAQHHPALETNRQKGMGLTAKIHGIEQEIRDLDLMAVSTPLERESKERQLEKLREMLKTVRGEAEQFTHAGGSPALSPAVADATGCAIFREMQNLTADEVAIAFVGDKTEAGVGANDMLEISARGKTIRVALAALGLIDRRRGSLTSQGAVLLGLTKNRKLINDPPSNAQVITRLRNVLKEHLGIKDDPFERYRKSTGWEPRFTINDNRGAADKRAEREAESRTISYEELIERGEKASDADQTRQRFDPENDATEDWLKANDPDAPS